MRQNALLALFGSYAVDWLVISYWFIARPQRQLEEIINVAKQLAHPYKTPTQLSHVWRTFRIS